MNSHHLLLSMDSTIKGKRSTFLIMKHEKNLKDLISLRFSFWKEEEGFEPPRALTPLSVFKTDPFNQTWVFLQKIHNIFVLLFKSVEIIHLNSINLICEDLTDF